MLRRILRKLRIHEIGAADSPAHETKSRDDEKTKAKLILKRLSASTPRRSPSVSLKSLAIDLWTEPTRSALLSTNSTAGLSVRLKSATSFRLLRPWPGGLARRAITYKRGRDPMEGRISYWNEKRGFGFVKKDEGGVAFVHIRSVIDDTVETLPIGTRVTFDERPPKGAEDKPMAVNVSVVARL